MPLNDGSVCFSAHNNAFILAFFNREHKKKLKLGFVFHTGCIIHLKQHRFGFIIFACMFFTKSFSDVL
jgi:hypothetical protein